MGNGTSTITKEQYEANRARMTCGKEVVSESKNAKLAKKFLHAYNMRDWKTMNAIVGEGSSFSFKGADACIPLEMFMSQLNLLIASFPDVFITYDQITESEPGVVKISNLYSRGTHTGAPFAYPPLPAIPTTGKSVEEGPNQVVYLFENGKLQHLQIELAPGDLSGPAGFYCKIGGKLLS